MSNKLIDVLKEEIVRYEQRIEHLRVAIEALSDRTPVPVKTPATIDKQRLAALEKARAARWDNNKYAGRKDKLDKALRKIFVDASRFTVNQTLQILRHNGITQASYRDRRSFGNCVYHSLREMAKQGLVRPVRTDGMKETIWETVQPSLPMVALPNGNETNQVPEL